jgi:CubicO group peptidase (beta-lactamase class C family)
MAYMSLNNYFNRISKGLKSKLISSFALICLVPLLSAGCAGAAESLTDRATSEYPDIDSYVEQIQKHENIPGIAIVAVQGGEIIFCKAYGVSSVENNQPLTTATLFDLASLTKSFTALGVLLLEDAGIIDIDQPLQKYLPGFQIADARGADITVRHLLNQTSGIPGVFSEILIFNDSYAEMLASLGNLRLNGEPGSAFEYADLNYCLLGALIESVSGMTYEEYMEANIFTPLGMNHTTVDPDKAEALGKADGHQPMYGKVVVRNIPAMKSARAAGWVMSCAEDMGKWLLLNMNRGVLDGNQLIPADDIEQLHSMAVLYEDNNEQMAYGMGWSISYTTDILYHFHCGDTPNFTGDMLLLPDHQTGIAVMVNGQVSNVSHNIATQIANILLGLNLTSINVPWWAHWKALDTLATGILFSVIGLFIILGMYLWWLSNQFRAGKRCLFRSHIAGPFPPAWQIVLYSLPLVIFSMILAAGNVLLNTLYGYNIFEALALFGMGAPPGLYLSAILSIAILTMWVLLLVLVGLFVRQTRKAC